MSLTARERRNPPPRRKSCAACTKAKRRCELPDDSTTTILRSNNSEKTCARCFQRGIPCLFPAQRQLPRETMPGVSMEDTPSPVSAEDFNNVIGSIDSGVDLFDPLDLSLVDENLELVPQTSALVPPTAHELGMIAEAIANRLQWSIEEIKKAPFTMVLENQTPWCHHLLYKTEMPRSIQDAHGSCALYMAKNRINSPIILRSIESRVNDLLSSPPPITPLDCLAYTQALILYQIIRLFDGDIGARASAERTIPSLENSAIALFAHVRFHFSTPFSLPTYPVSPTKTFWQDWILQESMRRTLLFTFYFLQVYRVLAGHRPLHCDGRLGMCHSWTLSAHLWGAASPVAFADVWENKKHFVVTNAVFKEVLSDARADDVDRYGRILISSLMGTDDAQAWFVSKGGNL